MRAELQKSALTIAGCALLTVPLMLGMQRDPSFEVTSVRQNKSSEIGGRIQIQPGMFAASGTTVRQLILRAYGVQDFQIVSARSKPIPKLLTFFSQVTQRTVIDRTGLKGGFDIELSWTPSVDIEPAPTGAPAAEPN